MPTPLFYKLSRDFARLRTDHLAVSLQEEFAANAALMIENGAFAGAESFLVGRILVYVEPAGLTPEKLRFFRHVFNYHNRPIDG
jgi:hypothetical protein